MAINIRLPFLQIVVETWSLYLLIKSISAVAWWGRNLIRIPVTQSSSSEKIIEKEILQYCWLFFSYLFIFSHLTPMTCFFPNQFFLFYLNNTLEIYWGTSGRGAYCTVCFSYSFEAQFFQYVTTGTESGWIYAEKRLKSVTIMHFSFDICTIFNFSC